MSTYTLEAKFRLKDEFSKNVKKAKTAFGGINKTFKDSDFNFKNMNKGFKDATKNMIGNATKLTATFSALGLASFSIFKGYAELNQVMTKNSVLLNASKEDSKKLEEQVKMLGRTTSFTAKEVAMAQKYQIMAGYDLNKVLETTPKLLKLSIVAEEDLARTSDLVTDTMTALGLETKDLGRYLDVISNVANKGNTAVSSLMEAFLGGASSGITYGDSLEDLAMILGVLADNGRKGSEAGTMLNAVYANLAANSQKNAEMIKEQNKYGIRFYKKQKDGNIVFKGLNTILQELRPKLAKMTDAQRNQFLVTMIGKEHLSDFLKLLNSTPEHFDKMRDAAHNSAGTLDEINESMKNTPLQKINEMKSAFDGMKLALGEALAPTMIDAMGKLTSYFNQITDSGKLNPKNIESFFKSMKDNMSSALKIAAALWFTTTSIRALMGDPLALANLAMGAVAVGGWIGTELGKNSGKSLDSAVAKPAPLDYTSGANKGYTTSFGYDPYAQDKQKKLLQSTPLDTGFKPTYNFDFTGMKVETALNDSQINDVTNKFKEKLIEEVRLRK